MPPRRGDFLFTGACAVPVLPLNNDMSLAPELIALHAQYLAAAGVSTVWTGGTTSEGFACTPAERARVIQAWCTAAPSKIKVVAHVTYESYGDSQELALAAKAAGAVALGIAPTVLAPPHSPEQILQWMWLVGGATGLPLYLHYFPGKLGGSLADVSAASVLRAHKADPALCPTFAGIKFTSDNLVDFAACLEEAGYPQPGEEVDVQWGSGPGGIDEGEEGEDALEDEEQEDIPYRYEIVPAVDDPGLLTALAMGARGLVAAGVCMAPGAYQGLVAAVGVGDLTTAAAMARRIGTLGLLMRDSRRYGFARDITKAIVEARLEAWAKSDPAVLASLGLEGGGEESSGVLPAPVASETSSLPIRLAGPPRPPYYDLSESDRIQLRDDLTEMGFFEGDGWTDLPAVLLLETAADASGSGMVEEASTFVPVPHSEVIVGAGKAGPRGEGVEELQTAGDTTYAGDHATVT